MLVALHFDPLLGSRLTLWARDYDHAHTTYAALRTRYALTTKQTVHLPQYYVLKRLADGVGVQPVTIPAHHRHLWRRRTARGRTTSAEWLALHYGPAFPAWQAAFVARLRARKASGGLTLLRGAPGTGKTTYLRCLLAQLRRTHRFYYLPASNFHLLTSPALTDFWLQEGKDHLGRGGGS